MGTLQDFDADTFLYAPEDCELNLTENFIELIGKKKVYKFPKPKNLAVLSMNGEFKKGELVCVIPEQYTPGMKCDSILKFIGAAGTRVSMEYLRNKIVVSDCYCVKEGVIHYDEEVIHKKGATYKIPLVTIGGLKYRYNPDCMYTIPEGETVKAGQRICSGVEDMGFVFDHGNVDTDLAYSIFYSQIQKLNPGISTEVLEFTYSVLFTDVNDATGEHYNTARNVSQVLLKDGGTYQRIARQSPKSFLEKVDPFEGEEFTADEMSRRILMTLLNKF